MRLLFVIKKKRESTAFIQILSTNGVWFNKDFWSIRQEQTIMNIKIDWVAAVIVLCLLSVGAAAQSSKDNPVGVYVSAVTQIDITDQVESLGSLQANEAVSLASTVTELVTVVNFEDGQRVSKGDLLVQLDMSQELAQQAEEQARLNLAKRQVARFKPLAKRGAASESALDDARSELTVAKARLAAIDSQIAQHRIVAPFDGVVGLKNISVGALTQPGMALTTIDDDTVMRLDFSIPAVFLSAIVKGNKIRAHTSAYTGRMYEGVVDSIDSRVDPVTRSIVVRARIPNADQSLRPGLLMKVTLDNNLRSSLIVSEEAIVPLGKKSYVFLVSDTEGKNVVERREVILGARRKGEVEIASGLSAGDLVVTHGAIKLNDGAAITILATENDNETLTELLKQNDATNKKSLNPQAAISRLHNNSVAKIN